MRSDTPPARFLWTNSPTLPAAMTRPLRPSTRPAPHASAGADAAENAQNRAASPSPTLVGLCQAYTRKAGENPGKTLESPAFEALIAAAGGADEVPDAARGTAPAHPTRAPGDRPTGAPYGKTSRKPANPAPTSTGRP